MSHQSRLHAIPGPILVPLSSRDCVLFHGTHSCKLCQIAAGMRQPQQEIQEIQENQQSGEAIFIGGSHLHLAP